MGVDICIERSIGKISDLLRCYIGLLFEELGRGDLTKKPMCHRQTHYKKHVLSLTCLPERETAMLSLCGKPTGFTHDYCSKSCTHNPVPVTCGM